MGDPRWLRRKPTLFVDTLKHLAEKPSGLLRSEFWQAGLYHDVPLLADKAYPYFLRPTRE